MRRRQRDLRRVRQASARLLVTLALLVMLAPPAAAEGPVTSLLLGQPSFVGATVYVTSATPLDFSALSTRVRDAVERFRTTALPVPKGTPSIAGVSPAIKHVYQQLDLVAASDITVLVSGESGTGKELVARAIHERSARRKGPFVALNCAAVPESLQESELFGHERGAFSGAVERRRGRFDQRRLDALVGRYGARYSV